MIADKEKAMLDYGSRGSYRAWERMMERRKACRKFFFRLIFAAVFFSIGMGTQYYRDSDIRDMAMASMTRDIAIIESMPQPTEEQKAEAKKRAKKITTDYLNERKTK